MIRSLSSFDVERHPAGDSDYAAARGASNLGIAIDVGLCPPRRTASRSGISVRPAK
ncbi:hypothetical protein GGE07_005243 [Sinorhizobium terangae]|nr:hypothetical protein [Sinorhizobium terangae]